MKFVSAALLLFSLGIFTLSVARADEQFFGFARGAETLPGGHAEVYQFLTLRTGKDTGVTTARTPRPNSNTASPTNSNPASHS